MIKIYCYYAGINAGRRDQGDRSFYSGVARVINDDLTTTLINEIYSTQIKWIKNDIGAQRTTNIVPWTQTYLKSRKKYNKLYGEGNYELIWTTRESFLELHNKLLQEYIAKAKPLN